MSDQLKLVISVDSFEQQRTVLRFAREHGLTVDWLDEPEAEQRPKIVALGEVKPNGDERNFKQAQALIIQGEPMGRTEFVRALAKRTRTQPRIAGQRVKRWLTDGVLQLVEMTPQEGEP